MLELNQMIQDVYERRDKIFEEQKIEIYETIKTLPKWVILRELNEDGQYIQRLLEKLILEIQTKNNLLIPIK
jgi:flagellar assembly protein FliH